MTRSEAIAQRKKNEWIDLLKSVKDVFIIIGLLALAWVLTMVFAVVANREQLIDSLEIMAQFIEENPVAYVHLTTLFFIFMLTYHLMRLLVKTDWKAIKKTKNDGGGE